MPSDFNINTLLERYVVDYVAVLGAVKVGKSAIIHRILNYGFTGRYQETVDDSYTSDIRLKEGSPCVSIWDTTGGTEFPAQRSVAISNARGFVLVYSITDRSSYIEVQNLWRQIKTQRYDYRVVPCVIVGNMLDKENKRQVSCSEALEWTESVGLFGKFLEVSARENTSVADISELLTLDDSRLETIARRSPCCSKSKRVRRVRTQQDSEKSSLSCFPTSKSSCNII